MGCMTGCGRVILILLNLLFLMISLTLVAAGVLLKFFVNEFAEPLLGAVNAGLNEQTKNDFNIPDLDEITDLPFVGDIGIALIAFGAVLFLVSFLACCGACCRWRPLLILFVILMSIMVISQAIVGGLFLSKGSVLHGGIKDTVGDKVKDEFDHDGKDVFSFSVNIMQYLLECCGMRGWEDYATDKPPSCCLKEIVDGDSSDAAIRARQLACTSDPPTAPPAYYNSQGCYKVLQDKVLSSLTMAAIILAAILVLQVLEIIFAILIIKDVNDETNKIGPY